MLVVMRPGVRRDDECHHTKWQSRCWSGKTGWKNDLLPKSSRRPVLKRQLSAVAFNNLLGNREAKASAGASLAPRRIDPEKRLEYA
jgi:hypothetical protein